MFGDFKNWQERDNWANTQIIANTLRAMNRREEAQRRARMTPQELKAEEKADIIASWLFLIIAGGFFAGITAVIIWFFCQ